ncbi:uncharacterized protein LOC124352855 [Homalodisca vitripennis]|uniref:uncharacterized protein LOC124352855 n=1 Tax=Homalodisca vitripennis TaxID=197043 RepID=UPI001EEA6FE8|nr:uncharacterized protein LOC124352855 [Homalodisca vitripennis]KAG8320340.1 hypothetical protein J6590_071118 [Homalodisca vitripennis]
MENSNSNSIAENKENESKHENTHNKNDSTVKKDKESALSRRVSFIRESVSDSGVPQRKLSAAIEAVKRSSLCSQEAEADTASQVSDSTRVPRKFISTWRQACDRTKDRTKELLKRWRTLPEGNVEMMVAAATGNSSDSPASRATPTDNPHNWSVHVWASYIKRYPSEDENLMLTGDETAAVTNNLSSTQKEKLGHFFSHLLDNDHDDLISEQDFENFSERLRRFADWSTNSPEFHVMVQVQHGFVTTFMSSTSSVGDEEPTKVALWKQYIGLEEWFHCWSKLCSTTHSLSDFPVWLQYLPKLFFQAINKSGSGTISRDELSSFYSSMLGFTTQRVGEILDEAYKALTSNGDHPVSYAVYRLAFTNFLLGRHPNGPGQYLFGCVATRVCCFPIDYSALNCQPEDREHYTPEKRSNRVSVIV